MHGEVVNEMRRVWDRAAFGLVRFYDRNGRPIFWSDLARLKWRTPGYPIVRRHDVRNCTLMTLWLGWGQESFIGPMFETILVRDDVGVVVHRAETEMQAVRLHYLQLGEVLHDLEAPLSEVRGWLEIEE